MPLENIRFEEISIEHIKSLIDSGVREGMLIEYKEILPGASDDDKREFLADVSSFSNAMGGFILYGIREERDVQGKPTGQPAEISGCKVENIDAEIRKLENLLRDAIEPRIVNIRIKTIQNTGETSVFVLRVPKSLQSPHAVTFKGMMRFYSRNSAGKYQLAVSEIRSAFLRSHERIEEIRRFRINRVSEIVAGQTPVNVGDGTKTILHIIPLNPELQVNVVALDEKNTYIAPLYSHGYNKRINFDGLVSYNESLGSYAQFFRSGSIETVSNFIIRRREGKALIPSLAFEREIIETIKRFLLLFSEIGIIPPVAIILTLTRIRGFEMGVSNKCYSFDSIPIDRDDLFLPEVILEDFVNPGHALKIIFDAIWNASGWPNSHYYDEDGNWVGEVR